MQKVVCKQDYVISGKMIYLNGILLDEGLKFKKGKLYNVFMFDNDCYWIYFDNCILERFYVNDKSSDKYFDTYFYTLNEARKLKLKSINKL